MKSLIEINNYNGESTVGYDRVVYDVTNDKVWFDSSLYEWVDLGLPSGLQWASCNVGATKPEEYGLYFAWGDTQGYSADDVANGVKSFSWSTYKYCNGSSTTLTKYCNDSYYGADGFTDGLTTLENIDDAAYQADNGKCRIPTQEDFYELERNTNISSQYLNGKRYFKFTSKVEGYTDKSILIPVAGGQDSYGSFQEGSCMEYWCSDLDTSNPSNAYYVARDVSEYYTYHLTDNRCNGRSVRPVLPKDK